MLDGNGNGLEIGALVVIKKSGYRDWTPKGKTAGRIREIGVSACWCKEANAVLIEFSDGRQRTYWPSELIKVVE